MLKTLGTRRGLDALNFLKLAGCSLPPETLHYKYDNTKQGVVVLAEEFEVGKGKCTFLLPKPNLSDSVLLMVALAPEFVEAFPSAILPINIFDKNTIGAFGPAAIVTAKDAQSYTGPVAHYYLIASF